MKFDWSEFDVVNNKVLQCRTPLIRNMIHPVGFPKIITIQGLKDEKSFIFWIDTETDVYYSDSFKYPEHLRRIIKFPIKKAV